ncbi:hypothetical protein N5F23_22215 [Pseudomonas sichuanensis]|uniref:hypothetical protein n=1 Tax=Pseudomonas sichuanensis TaxID=2213015 RepID=UPI002447BBAE|nr:hypothetical protein [Pseudomonas sichuanensis]MDH0733122.1 hypothetical protein [Pseudomonas sichuanensis]MDH1585306.1 hypothetical protein [Pseudomonas sichuanensis]MDH1591939.1 hypothetical protein [Pseudomonas sichuanensis]MDH1597287.1 hypothetical protein [Pseudomonas sichuanensis]
MYRTLPALIALMLSTQALGAYQPPAGSEADYRQAVASLDVVEPQLMVMVQKLAQGTPAQDLEPRLGQLRGQWTPALQQLQRAADAGHAVAQYRMALYLFAYQADAIELNDPNQCALLTKSLEQGFAPAAGRMVNLCIGYVDGPAYAPALNKALSDFSQFTAYYPQPTVTLECAKPNPQDIQLQWGDATAYQAELYRLLGFASDRRSPLRREFWQKAIDINGCPAVARRMDRLQN